MVDHAFLVSPKENPINAIQVDKAVRPVIEKVQASTVAAHTIPWIVIVHCTAKLTEAEEVTIQSLLANLEGESS